MRFVKDLCWSQIKLLHRIHKESKKHHQALGKLEQKESEKSFLSVRQRAHCILLSHQRTKVPELARIFGKTKRTIYIWLNLWETHHFVGLYDSKGRGRKPKLDDDQKRQVKEWAKEYPKNLRKIVALVREEYGISVSRRTIKRILRNLGFS